MSQAPNLARPISLGKLTLKNRLVLASMTRNRAPYTIPGPEMVEYYTQRANAGLIITEGVMIVPIGSEWPQAPGIWSNKQIEGWKVVNKAVHEKDSKIFAQIWHIGRVAHPLHQAGQPALSPSGIPAKGGKFRLLAGEPGYVSDPVEIEDPSIIVEQYRAAAVNAFKANFDGIELHAANGYLPHQFLESHSNKRTDAYGGSAEKRAKFVLDIIKVFIEVAGDSKKVGIKLSPTGGYNDMGEPEDVLTEEYSYLISQLDKLDIGYIQLSRYNPDFDPEKRGTNVDVYAKFRKLITKPLVIGNAGYQPDEAEKHVAEGVVDAVAFGRPYIANPDLADRIFNGHALNWNVDWAHLYNAPEGQPLGAAYTSYKPFGQE